MDACIQRRRLKTLLHESSDFLELQRAHTHTTHAFKLLSSVCLWLGLVCEWSSAIWGRYRTLCSSFEIAIPTPNTGQWSYSISIKLINSLLWTETDIRVFLRTQFPMGIAIPYFFSLKRLWSCNARFGVHKIHFTPCFVDGVSILLSLVITYSSIVGSWRGELSNQMTTILCTLSRVIHSNCSRNRIHTPHF